MADTKISALAAATTAAAANELAINEAGASKKLTVDQIRQFLYVNNPYAPGSFTVATENFVAHVKRLQLTGSQRATLQGTARVRID